MRVCKVFWRSGCLLVMSMLSILPLCAEERAYLCEFGVQGGLSYYVGDATKHIFQHVQPAYGAHFRYKFTPRWALQVKGQADNIKFPLQAVDGDIAGAMGKNLLMNIDAVAEFNFFRLGMKQYDTRIKPITPYMFIGIGLSVYNGFGSITGYIPFGFGLKWKFAPRFGLTVSWQHQIYFADNLENREYYNNTYQLNGSNILNKDFTSSLTIGIVFEFVRERAVCRTCSY